MQRSSYIHASWSMTSIAVLVGALFAPAVQGASFQIDNDATETAVQTLNDNETGVIQTRGALVVTSSPAVLASGHHAVIRNDGSIEATGTGVLSSGDNVSIANNGSIDAYGVAIGSTGADAVIDNSGSIMAAGTNNQGILSTGSNARISSSGLISTTGDNAYGIVSLGVNASGAVINNRGTIVTAGSDAFGIASAGVGAVINNGGTIKSVGDRGYGIYSSGNSVSVRNTGLIATSGPRGVGIVSIGQDAAISNSGMIATTGNQAHGIAVSGGSNASITNSGTIVTTGDGAYGIASSGANTTITHSGSIRVSGPASAGIFSGSSNAIVNVSGLVSAAGVGSYGLFSLGNDAILNISGRISATSGATQAVLASHGATLNLLSGAEIIGTIDMNGGPVNVALNGGGRSATMTIANPGAIHQSGKGLSFVSGNTVTIVDTTNLSANQAALGSAAMSQFQAVSQQLDQAAPPTQPIKVAASELTPGMLHQDQGPTAWGHVFGGQNKRDASGAALGYIDNGYGLIGGYEQTLGEHRVGVFGGLSRSAVKADSNSAQTDNDSVFLGLYGQYITGDWNINGALALGHISADNDRQVVDNVYGYQTASASNHTTYLSPSIAITRPIDLGAGISLRPSAQLNYTWGRVSGYSESGTTRSNLSVGSHDASVLNTRLQVAVRQTFAEHQGEFEVRVGAMRIDFGKDKAKINLRGGAATDYSLTGTDSVSGGFVGAGGRLTLKNGLSLVGDVEYTQGRGDNHAAAGYVGLEYQY